MPNRLSHLSISLVFCLLLAASLLLWLGCADEDNPASPQDNPTDTTAPTDPPDTTVPLPTNVVYVTADGTGDGSRDDPLGSIQAAIDIAAGDSTLTTVFVAGGTYEGSVRIANGMQLHGGLRPDKNWEFNAYLKTVLQSLSVDSLSAALTISNVADSVIVSGLVIDGPDAVMPGENAYGIYCADAAAVTLTGCTVTAGNGVAGVSGENGLPGQAGDSLSPGQGGAGGRGGYYDYASYILYWHRDGLQGDCPDNPGAGGLGGTNSAEDGHTGQDGTPGVNGSGGGSSPIIARIGGYDQPSGGYGFPGEDSDSWGCGGGGGAGNNAVPWKLTGDYKPGATGGTGGAGGGPATGATGGAPGGWSAAVFAINSAVQMADCSLSSGHGGVGGGGGTGGPGGAGQLGSDWWGYPDQVGPAGTGGTGGTGGRGGHGGGGDGGWSVGIVTHNSTVTTDETVTIETGVAGAGGTSPGNAGSPGTSTERLNITM